MPTAGSKRVPVVRVLADHLVDLHRGAAVVVDGLDRRVPAEEAHQLAGRVAVVLPVVEGDRAGVAVDETDAGVGERHVAVLAEALRQVGLVLLGAAEAVGDQERRRPAGGRHAGRHVQVGVDLTGPVLRPQVRHRDRQVPSRDVGGRGRRQRDRPTGGQHGAQQDRCGSSHRGLLVVEVGRADTCGQCERPDGVTHLVMRPTRPPHLQRPGTRLGYGRATVPVRGSLRVPGP